MAKKEKYTKEELISGLKKQNDKVIHYIYNEYFPVIRQMVMQNSGNESNAKDLFQNALIVVYQQSHQKNDFTIDCSFLTYLYSICKNKWLNELRRRRIIDFKPLDKLEENTIPIEETSAQEELINEERESLYKKHFEKLSKECQIILRMFHNDMSFEKIAVSFGLKNANQAKKKKYRCKKKLMESIAKDKVYKELN